MEKYFLIIFVNKLYFYQLLNKYRQDISYSKAPVNNTPSSGLGCLLYSGFVTRYTTNPQ